MQTMITCPFCKDDNFDEVGLKIHLVSGHCDPFNATEGVNRNRYSVSDVVDHGNEAYLAGKEAGKNESADDRRVSLDDVLEVVDAWIDEYDQRYEAEDLIAKLAALAPAAKTEGKL